MKHRSVTYCGDNSGAMFSPVALCIASITVAQNETQKHNVLWRQQWSNVQSSGVN